MKLMDTSNSRKLQYVNSRELDEKIPYTTDLSTGRPYYYTRRGDYIELIRIPDAAYHIYVQYSQWPDEMVEELDTSPFEEVDDVIVSLSIDMAKAILGGGEQGKFSWLERAKLLLKDALVQQNTKVDRVLIARPFDPQKSDYPVGKYWADPFQKRDP